MSDYTGADEEKAEITETTASVDESDPDAKFGGREARLALERKLLWKIDLRILGVLVPIYILNYVCADQYVLQPFSNEQHRWTGTTLGMYPAMILSLVILTRRP